MKTNTNSTRIYFVDEAGDSDIFNKKGKVIIGNSGCSKYFILGLLDIPDPASIENNFSSLRKELLSDPYFKGIPSLKVSNRKTAHNFHAKEIFLKCV